jgi:hypothetical protein
LLEYIQVNTNWLTSLLAKDYIEYLIY